MTLHRPGRTDANLHDRGSRSRSRGRTQRATSGPRYFRKPRTAGLSCQGFKALNVCMTVGAYTHDWVENRFSFAIRTRRC